MYFMQYTILTAGGGTMEWTEAIQSAIRFIENHITEDISAKDVADHVHISPFYFQ